VLTAAVSFVANAVFSLMFMGPPDAGGAAALTRAIAAASGLLCVCDLRHAGLALATALAATVNVTLLLLFLVRRLGGLETRALAASLARSLAAGLLMTVPVWLTSRLVDWSGGGPFLPRALVLLMSVSVGVSTFGVVVYALGSPEIGALRELWRERFRS
jgi:putative peptidoglycan lipid II flippase